MTEKEKRIQELQSQIAFANGLGVRANICGDAKQAAEAKRLYEEAMREIKQLRGENTHD